ncbi:MAG: hypothetical protein JNJ44_05495 [Zoogloeaceae bacterium]|nr:hypothetical protein [Zoogloeaceae bacterium]
MAPLLGASSAALFEMWRSDGPVETGTGHGVSWARQGGVLFAVVEVPEAVALRGADETTLQAAGRVAYEKVFALAASQGIPHLWRVWNFLADINRETDGLERYRQFNQGRQHAFMAAGRAVRGAVPAASALGLAGGPVSVAFLAGFQPLLAIENPRQISAYDYPPEYGPASPTFSRAGLVRLDRQAVLFISGTASIVGHATLHTGDAARQCHESLDNIEALLARAAEISPDAGFGLSELTYRVYVRHPGDYAQVCDVLRSRVGAVAPAIFLQADVCRSELLLEVEAVGFREARP